MGEPADQAQVLVPGEVLVDRGVLAGEADALADGLRVLGHVDEAIRWLEDHLRKFAGALLFVTHDRAFLTRSRHASSSWIAAA